VTATEPDASGRPEGEANRQDPARDRIPFAQPSANPPLAGVRVIDAGNMVAAPFATVLLGDFGADVIKLEHPKLGDGERKLEPIKRGATGESVPLWWKNGARNKRCVTLDLSKPEGAELFKELVATADVVVENYRPGTFERWGLGYEELKKVNPRLILLRISGFGQTGPYRDRGGFGRVAEAMGGLTNLIGETDGAPMTPGIPLGDLITGLMGSWAVMIALYHRDARGGDGQIIDLGLYESVFRLLEFDPIQYDQIPDDPKRPEARVHTRSGNQLSYVAPSSMFRTSDGKWLTLAASTQQIFDDLCRAINREDLIADPRFGDNPSRVRHREEINGIIADWISERTRGEVAEILDARGLPYSLVFDMADVFQNEQYLAREMLVRVLDAQLGDAIVQNVVPKFSETPGAVTHLGPQLGEHNDEIFGGELGYSPERLSELRAAAVI
jgi:crotonobetainyl-CoA:carnitine CoA-transferase CaiB-like acyl-CoA transferase